MKHTSTQCGQKMRKYLVTGQVVLADSQPLSSLDRGAGSAGPTGALAPIEI